MKHLNGMGVVGLSSEMISSSKIKYYNKFLLKVSQTILIQELGSEKCSDLIFVGSPCEKLYLCLMKTITSAKRKFMLDMQTSGRFQNIGL